MDRSRVGQVEDLLLGIEGVAADQVIIESLTAQRLFVIRTSDRARNRIATSPGCTVRAVGMPRSGRPRPIRSAFRVSIMLSQPPRDPIGFAAAQLVLADSLALVWFFRQVPTEIRSAGPARLAGR